jgi:hypothetical protein
VSVWKSQVGKRRKIGFVLAAAGRALHRHEIVVAGEEDGADSGDVRTERPGTKLLEACDAGEPLEDVDPAGSRAQRPAARKAALARGRSLPPPADRCEPGGEAAQPDRLGDPVARGRVRELEATLLRVVG